MNTLQHTTELRIHLVALMGGWEQYKDNVSGLMEDVDNLVSFMLKDEQSAKAPVQLKAVD